MRWAEVAFRVFPFIVAAVHGVESLCSGATGASKQDAAVDLVKSMISATEGGSGRQLLDDADVEKATRGAIDAYVALQNIMATKAAAAPPV